MTVDPQSLPELEPAPAPSPADEERPIVAPPGALMTLYPVPTGPSGLGAPTAVVGVVGCVDPKTGVPLDDVLPELPPAQPARVTVPDPKRPDAPPIGLPPPPPTGVTTVTITTDLWARTRGDLEQAWRDLARLRAELAAERAKTPDDRLAMAATLIDVLKTIADHHTANLSPEFIKDLPADAYAVAAELVAQVVGATQRDHERAEVWRERVALIREYADRRTARAAGLDGGPPETRRTTNGKRWPRKRTKAENKKIQEKRLATLRAAKAKPRAKAKAAPKAKPKKGGRR